MWQRFWISAVFTVPLLYIAMGHMVGLPLPAFESNDTCDDLCNGSIDFDVTRSICRQRIFHSWF